MFDCAADESKERRIYHRYRLPLNFRANSKVDKVENEQLCNISKGGACFVSNTLYNQNDFIMLNFSTLKDLPVDETHFSIVGKIVWVVGNKKDLYKYGAQFEFYDDTFSKQQYSNMVSTINKCASFSSAYRCN